jgi:hypothetical protein
MGPRVDQMEEDIPSSRDYLRSSLEELGQEVKLAVDWREKFRANPAAMLAVAFGGGFLIAKLLNASGVKQDADSEAARRAASSTWTDQGRRLGVSSSWDDIQGALVGVVADKVTKALGEVVPGFNERLAYRKDDARAVNGHLTRQ